MIRKDKKKKKTDDNKEILLNTAEQLFAEKGFHAVSVREITCTADTNLAAVNYHFQSKENLYLEVFRQRFIPRAHSIVDPLLVSLNNPDITLEILVRNIIQTFVGTSLPEEERNIHVQLIFREMIRPGPAFDVVFEELIKPNIPILLDLLGRFLPAGFPMHKRIISVVALMGLGQYFSFARTAIQRVSGIRYRAEDLDGLVAAITEFALHGLATDPEVA